MSHVGKVDAKRRVVLPEAWAEMNHLNAGAVVVFVPQGKGVLEVRALEGYLDTKKNPKKKPRNRKKTVGEVLDEQLGEPELEWPGKKQPTDDELTEAKKEGRE
jgi:bifunctional DNA-binding transcriptional regulator/antitoxin component of YhaV-PrlF toxin-antitoxin module